MEHAARRAVPIIAAIVLLTACSGGASEVSRTDESSGVSDTIVRTWNGFVVVDAFDGDAQLAHDPAVRTFPGLGAFGGACDVVTAQGWTSLTGEFTTEMGAAQIGAALAHVDPQGIFVDFFQNDSQPDLLIALGFHTSDYTPLPRQPRIVVALRRTPQSPPSNLRPKAAHPQADCASSA